MKIIFIVPYPTDAVASQRFRFEQYFQFLKNAGHDYTISSFFSSKSFNLVHSSQGKFAKLLALSMGFAKRLATLSYIHRYDYVFIHREASPIGPPFFEWIAAKIAKKKIIYDFDDAIWLTDRIQESTFEKVMRCRKKVHLICKWSFKISCGNAYLANYAKKFNRNVVIIPTTIDTSHHQKKDAVNPKTTIGWTGSRSTLKYFEDLEPVLLSIESQFPHIEFIVIADAPPVSSLTRIKFIKWKKETEIADLATIDIGIMPLPDNEWTRGKCGFKALQYLAMEIPAVVSAVGVNTKIINDGVNGFVCTTNEDWYKTLKMLITDKQLRLSMGKSGRTFVIQNYSVISNVSNFLSLFQ